MPRFSAISRMEAMGEVLEEDEILDGGEVLPGLSLPLRQVFARLSGKTRGDTRPSAGKARKRRKGG